ncbi:MAG: peroxidase family protein, partial [Saprospiraceae bacterium]
MHGEIRPHDTRMSEEAITRENGLLKSGFNKLLRPNIPPPIDWAKVIEDMTFQMEETGGQMAPDNRALPAAYTYFGQLLTHDITAHRFLNSKPQLRLHTMYGLGPASSPQFFQHQRDPKEGYMFRGVKLTLDDYVLEGSADQEVVHDFFRVPQERRGQEGTIPLMADARNDQNFITSQLVVKLAQLHNRLAEDFFDRSLSPGHLFEKASRELVRKYQAVILTDYLPRILHPKVVKRLQTLAKGTGFIIFNVKQECQLSEVFSRAAMRFGHSMARQMYQVQLQRQQIHLFNADIDLRGFSRNPRRKIDWICLLEEGKINDQPVAFQPAKAFDTNIVLALNNLPFFPGGNRSLAGKNIDNSYQNFILTKDFWKALEMEDIDPIEDGDLKNWVDKFDGKIDLEDMPLWIYLLLEAEKLGGAKTLGPLGSQIIAEQIIWAMLNDPHSVLKEEENAGKKLVFNWERYTLKQLLEEAGEDFGAKKQALLPTYWTSQNAMSPRMAAAPSSLVTIANLVAPFRSRSVYLGDELGLQYQWRNNPAELWRLAYLVDGADPQIPVPERQVDFPANASNAQIARSAILKNGYYWYPISETEATVRTQIANGTLPSDSTKKREIRCYVSRSIMLKFCGAATPVVDPA